MWNIEELRIGDQFSMRWRNDQVHVFKGDSAKQNLEVRTYPIALF